MEAKQKTEKDESGKPIADSRSKRGKHLVDDAAECGRMSLEGRQCHVPTHVAVRILRDLAAQNQQQATAVVWLRGWSHTMASLH
jgi:hypothetical protein